MDEAIVQKEDITSTYRYGDKKLITNVQHEFQTSQSSSKDSSVTSYSDDFKISRNGNNNCVDNLSNIKKIFLFTNNFLY